jgi:exodeoxyribonuclease V gamma subunit
MEIRGSGEKDAMIRVWYSNQLEKLAGRLMGNLGLGDSASSGCLFSMPPIVVPNRNIETYLKYEIARGAGIAAGLNFYVPEQFQDELLALCQGRQQPERRRLHTALLRACLLDILSDQENPGSAPGLPDAVRSYLDAPGDHRDARDLHRFQLAGRLARLFHQYNDARPDLLRNWSAKRTNFDSTANGATEEWQRYLWDRLSEQLPQPYHDQPIRWIFPFEIVDIVDDSEVTLPPELHLFGFSYLSHGVRELIERLGRESQIDLYTFTPVGWRTGSAAYEAAANVPMGHNDQGRLPDDRAGGDDASIAIRWGRPGREHFEELVGAEGVKLNPEVVSIETATTLGRLQAEILGAESPTSEPFQRDDSLVILACPGIRREAEIVGNEIWRLIREDDERQGRSPGRLRFPEIAVLVADTANLAAYQAHFRAVLEELYDIPFNMVDLPLAGESRLLEAVLLLLDLPLGEFTRPEVLKVLMHPAVQARLPQADCEAWRSWAVDLEVVHGADREDHQGTYIEGEVFHWDQGLRRLALGAFMSGPRAGDERAFELDGADYLPFDLPADALPSSARLVLLVRSLAADARFARSARLTMAHWSEFFAAMLEAYVAAANDSEERVRAMCLHEIRGLAQLDVTGHEVGYRIAAACLREAIRGQTAARGYYLADGVVVSPLREMRALPFRVIFVCGLGEGLFPVRADLDPLDLAAAEPRIGDVTPRDRDKYLLLETLACARERLYLSYVAKDAQTGDELNSSPLLCELLRCLHRGYPGELDPASFWVNKEPLRRFDAKYFEGKDPVHKPASVSLAAAARQEWQALKLRESLAASQGGRLMELKRDSLRQLDSNLANRLGLCSLDGAKTSAERGRRLAISLSDVRKFLECPLQGWARVMLRLNEDDDEDESQRLDEHFVTGKLREIGLLRAVFLDAVQANCEGSSPDAFKPFYDRRAAILARQGLSPVGLFGEVEERRHLDCLAGWFQFARQGSLLRHGPFGVYRFGRAAEAERVERVGPAIILEVKLPGEAEPRLVELYGRTEIVSTDLPGSLIPVGRAAASEKDFLRGFLDAVALSLQPDHRGPALYHAHVIPLPTTGKRAQEATRSFRGIDAQTARQFLTTVLADLFGGPHDYLLPCEAVFDCLNPKKKRAIADAVEDMKENPRSSCSSRYGPVPDFERYDPPDQDEAHAMIERRFGLFRDSGGQIA